VSTISLCPYCGSPYDTSDLHGPCRVCGKDRASGIAAAPASPAAAASPGDEKARLTPEEAALRIYRAVPWATMRQGLGLLAASLLIDLGSIPVEFVFKMFPSGPHVLLLVAARVIGGLLGLVGVILCCRIPRAAGARHWVLGVVFSLLAVVVLIGLAFVMGLSTALGEELQGRHMPGDVALPLLGLVGLFLLVFLIGSVSFTMLLRAAARYWDDLALAAGFVRWLVVYLGILVLGTVLTGVYLVSLLSAGDAQAKLHAGDSLAAVGCVGLLFRIGMTVWAYILTHTLRSDIPAQET
jgi:hypothetical protein